MMELESLLSSLAPRLLRYCRARLGDAVAAEEVAQEALTALVRCFRRGSPPDSPEAFVFAIARRRLWRVRLRSRLRSPLEALGRDPDPRPDPEKRAVERQRLRTVAQAIGRLRRGQREALLLVAVSEVDRPTAARLLGISEVSLKMRLHRARRRLAEILEEGGPAIDRTPPLPAGKPLGGES